MLSSVLQQTGDIPNIIFSVAYPRDNGNPRTEDVCSFFKDQGLNIKEQPYDGMDEIQYRGLARNRQMREATADWILFADTDMTYAPDFFEDLGRQLVGPLKNETRCISARRVSLAKEECKQYFNELDPHVYPCVVEEAGLLEGWPIYQISRSCGAGYFQLANVANIRDNCDNLYVDPEGCNDWGWLKGKKMQKAKSDGQFRKRVGGIKRIKTKPQYHLNHERDNEAGEHLVIQR
jgi:hypothetical protein